MNPIVENYLGKLLASRTREEVWAASSDAFALLGFEDVFYGVKGGDRSGAQVLVSDPLTDWKRDYQAAGDSAYDPLFTYSAMLPNTFFTGLDCAREYPFITARDLAVIHRATDHGLLAGAAIIMPPRNSRTVGGWHIMSRHSREDFARRYRSHAASLSQIAGFSHTALDRLARPDLPLTVALSTREAETLCWLAAGLRTDQIAEKMAIRPVTVDLHIRRARERLGARTREQAIAIALSAGLISL